MTDILTRLAALTVKDENGMMPCVCGSTEYSLWDGKGTQAEASCENCGNAVSVQVVDLFDPADNIDLDMNTLRYPPAAIEKTRVELTRLWNEFQRQSDLIALVQEAAGEIERLRQERSVFMNGFRKAVDDYDMHIAFLHVHGIVVQNIPECIEAQRLWETLNPQQAP